MLLSTYSDANKVISSRPVVTYHAEPTYNSEDEDAVVAYWTLTRESSENFKYVGLTKSAAETCASDMRNLYTRKYAEWTAAISDYDGSSYVTITPAYKYECAADISANAAAGSAWEVSVSTNDTDVIISKTEPKSIADFESLFQEALSRDVSATTLYLAVSSAEWFSTSERTNVVYTHKGSSFDESLVGVEIKNDDGTYTAATVTSHSDGKIQFETDSNCTFRLSYNTNVAYSRDYTTTNEPSASLVIDSCSKSVTAPSWNILCNTGIRLTGRATLGNNLALAACKLQIYKDGSMVYQVPFDGVTDALNYAVSFSQSGSQWKFDVTLTGSRVCSLGLDFMSNFQIGLYTPYNHGPVDAPLFTPTKSNYIDVSDVAFNSATSALTFDLTTDIASATAAWLASNLVVRYSVKTSTSVSMSSAEVATVVWNSTDSVFNVTAYVRGLDFSGNVFASIPQDESFVYAQNRACSGGISDVGYYTSTFDFLTEDTSGLELGTLLVASDNASYPHRYNNLFELYKLDSGVYTIVASKLVANDGTIGTIASALVANANYRLLVKVVNPNIGAPSGTPTILTYQTFNANFFSNPERITYASFASTFTNIAANAFAISAVAEHLHGFTIPMLNQGNYLSFAQTNASVYPTNITATGVTKETAATNDYYGVVYGTFTGSNGSVNIDERRIIKVDFLLSASDTVTFGANTLGSAASTGATITLNWYSGRATSSARELISTQTFTADGTIPTLTAGTTAGYYSAEFIISDNTDFHLATNFLSSRTDVSAVYIYGEPTIDAQAFSSITLCETYGFTIPNMANVNNVAFSSVSLSTGSTVNVYCESTTKATVCSKTGFGFDAAYFTCSDGTQSWPI